MTPTSLIKPAKITAALALAAVLIYIAVIASTPTPDVKTRAHAARAMLDHARATGALAQDSDLMALPLPDAANPANRKTIFIAALLPRIVRENARIIDQRVRAMHAREGDAQYAALAHAYGLHPNVPRAVLLSRIDIVPASMALAQGAVESAWGTSRFARQGNAYFGERTYDEERAGLKPKATQDTDTPFKVKTFPRVHLSVRSFMKTLNTHPAYRALREQRAALRAQGQRPTGLALTPFLRSYSEIGGPYITRVIAVIQRNRLEEFEGLAFIDE